MTEKVQTKRSMVSDYISILKTKNNSVINILVSFIQSCTEPSKAKMNQEKMNESNQDIDSLTSFSIFVTATNTSLFCFVSWELRDVLKHFFSL